MSSQPEAIGDVTEAQFHANNAIINAAVEKVNKNSNYAKQAFAEISRLAGRLNAHLFHCHIAHVNLGVVNGIYRALGDTIAKYDPAQPDALLANIKTVLAFIEEHAPQLKKDMQGNGH